MPAINSCDYLTPQKPKSWIKAKQFSNYQCSNLVDKNVTNNFRCFVVNNFGTAQFRHSFFVDSVIKWNHLPDSIIHAETVEIFMFYKIIHFQVAIYPSDLLFHSDSRTRQSDPNCYKHIQTSKGAYKYSFYPRTIIQWNQLPSSIVTVETVESFKGLLTVPVLIPILTPILN